MLGYFKELVRQEKPNTIFDLQCVEVGGLNAVTCKYSKGGMYFVAVSFFTESWIAKNPTCKIGDRASIGTTLRDVATIFQLSDKEACIHYSCVTERSLNTYLTSLKSGLKEKFNLNGFSCFQDDELTVHLLLDPVPSLLIKIKNKNRLVGTIALQDTSSVIPIMVLEDRVYDYCKILRSCSNSRVLPVGIN